MRSRTSLAACSRFGDGVGIRNRVVGRGQILHRAVQLLAAGLVEVLQLGLLAHQLDFDLRALLVALFHAPRAACLRSSSPARRASRMAASCSRHFVHRALRACVIPRPARRAGGPARCCRPAGARARSPSRSISGAMALRRAGGLAELLFQAAHGRALPALPLFEARQFGANAGVLLADGRGLRFQLLQFLPLGFQRLFALRRAAAPSPRPRRGCARAARRISRRRAAAVPAPDAPPKAANWRAPDRRPACAFRDPAPRGLSRAPAATPRSRSSSASRATISWLQPIQPRHHARRAPLWRACQRHRQLARFALHGQRAGAGFLAAGHGVAVVADAVGQQEIEVRIADRQALRRGAVFRQETQRDAAAAGPPRGL